jgi:hypothetical protein
MIPHRVLAQGAIPIEERRDVDVLVVGGGTAGFIAAVASARSGAHTIVAESLPFLGGTHGGGSMVMGTIGFRVIGAKDMRVERTSELVVRGLPLEYYERMLSAGATTGAPGEPSSGWPKDLELSKVVIDEFVRDSGADTWFGSQLVDVVMEGSTVIGALITRGGGLTFVRCRTLIDATGDAIAATRAGAEFAVGRPSDGRMEAATLYFELGGVDVDALLEHLAEHPEVISVHHRGRGVSAATLRSDIADGRPFVVRLGPGYAEARAAGELPTPVGARPGSEPSLGTFWMHWRDGRWVPTSFSVNMDTTYGLDPRDRDRYDEALIDSRRFVMDMVRVYQRYAPGFRDAYLLRFATTLGVREGPRIVGEHTLSADDVFAATDFPDAVGRCGVRVDIHPEDDGGREFLLRDVGGDRGWFQIPYRCLVPEGVDGLLVAGRAISADHIAHGSIRHQVTCMVTGQAVGTAAALAARSGVAARHVASDDLQDALRAADALI